MPVHLLPFSCFERSEASVSIGSIPAFSLSESGMASKASANFSAASCSRPGAEGGMPPGMGGMGGMPPGMGGMGGMM